MPLNKNPTRTPRRDVFIGSMLFSLDKNRECSFFCLEGNWFAGSVLFGGVSNSLWKRPAQGILIVEILVDAPKVLVLHHLPGSEVDAPSKGIIGRQGTKMCGSGIPLWAWLIWSKLCTSL